LFDVNLPAEVIKTALNTAVDDALAQLWMPTDTDADDAILMNSTVIDQVIACANTANNV
jgi:hypothetical protein